jgi:hypothetical protein
MSGRYYDNSFPGSKPDRAIQSVLEHRAGPGEGAVLLRFLMAKPSPDKVLGPYTITARQHY